MIGLLCGLVLCVGACFLIGLVVVCGFGRLLGFRLVGCGLFVRLLVCLLVLLVG